MSGSWPGGEGSLATALQSDRALELLDAQLAARAGAHHVVNYHDTDAADQIRRVAPTGVNIIIEVAAGANAELDQSVIAARGTTAIYANDGGIPFAPDVGTNMALNARYQFVLLYTVGWDRIANAAADLNRAIDDGALRIGEEAGLPVHRFGLDDTAAAHDAVEGATVGKVLTGVSDLSLRSRTPAG